MSHQVGSPHTGRFAQQRYTAGCAVVGVPTWASAGGGWRAARAASPTPRPARRGAAPAARRSCRRRRRGACCCRRGRGPRPGRGRRRRPQSRGSGWTRSPSRTLIRASSASLLTSRDAWRARQRASPPPPRACDAKRSRDPHHARHCCNQHPRNATSILPLRPSLHVE